MRLDAVGTEFRGGQVRLGKDWSFRRGYVPWWEPQGTRCHYKIVAKAGDIIVWQGNFSSLAKALHFWQSLHEIGPTPHEWDMPFPSWYPGLNDVPGITYYFATVQDFTASGTFGVVTQGATSYLVLGAGGGGASGTEGGGGGAGQFLSASATLSVPPYTITVAGTTAADGTGGTSSISGGVASAVGGGRGGGESTNGGNGASGGGGGGGNPAGSGGTATAGNNGGAGTNFTPGRTSGGGGGASAAGTSGDGTTGGAGGNGSASSISGASVTYCGGGGGGTEAATGGTGAGGTGGGGAGGPGAGSTVAGDGRPGTSNLGGGGGGCSRGSGSTGVFTGGTGGSGRVILSYNVAIIIPINWEMQRYTVPPVGY